MTSARLASVELWVRGLIAAGISGAAGGILTGLAAIGIDPEHFNFAKGLNAMLQIAGAAAIINALIGVAAFLQKSPLPDLPAKSSIVQ
jgi:hypothetical protein